MQRRACATAVVTWLAVVGPLASTAVQAAPKSLREAMRPVPVGVFGDASSAYELAVTASGGVWLRTPASPGPIEGSAFRLDDVLFVRTRGPSWRLRVTSDDELAAIDGLPTETRLRRTTTVPAGTERAATSPEPPPAELHRVARGQCHFSASVLETRVRRGPRIRQAFEHCCKAGDMDSCAAVADLRSRLSHEDDEAHATLAPLCLAGSARACDALSELETRRARPAEAHRWLQRACDRRSPNACAALRDRYISPPASSGAGSAPPTRTEAAGSPSKL